MPLELPFNALQIALRSLHFDRITTPIMWGYVVGITRRNLEGEGQLYVSHGSFKIRRDFRLSTRDDEVFRWDGEGELVFSSPLEGLDQVGVDLYFVRDNRRLRELGLVLDDLLGQDGLGRKILSGLGRSSIVANPAGGFLVALLPEALRQVTRILKGREDRIKVLASGTLNLSDMITNFRAVGDPDGYSPTRKWGIARADKGYFEIDCDFVNLSDPKRLLLRPADESDRPQG